MMLGYNRHLDTSIGRWLPVDFQLDPDPRVMWVDFGSKGLDEPFFQETVLALQREKAAQRLTGIAELVAAAKPLREVAPAGVILHISRCGSTLLSNALKAARSTAVLSEARTILLLTNPPFEATRVELLRSVISLYSHRLEASSIVLKCHPISLLNIRLIRSIWPAVPFVIVIRDPVEIMVSMFEKPAGWLQFFRTPLGGSLFGWPQEVGAAMAKEEYCGRVLGRFCEAAMAEDDCTVLDYSALDETAIRYVAGLFGLELPAAGSDVMQRILKVDAKDVEGRRRFEEDGARKRRAGTPLMRQMVEVWAEPQYQALKRRAVKF